MYASNLIADYLIKRSNQLGKAMSNLKLQKILYFIQAEFLVTKGEACFSENIEAWDFGPVVPNVYHKYKIYGSSNIPYIDDNCVQIITDEDKKLIDGIFDECSKYSASTLVEITHQQSPWKEAYRPYCSMVISNKSIKEYFEEA